MIQYHGARANKGSKEETQEETQRQLGRPCDCSLPEQQLPPLWFDLWTRRRKERWIGLSLAEVVEATMPGVGVGGRRILWTGG